MDSNMPNDIDPYINSGGSIDRNFERESWRDMAQNFYVDVRHLLEKEGHLIKAEMNEKAGQVKVASISLVVAGVLLFVGVLCVAATAIILLNLVTKLWASALIVTVFLLAVGAILFFSAKKKLNIRDLRPSKSIEAFGEIGHSLKEKVHEITKH